MCTSARRLSPRSVGNASHCLIINADRAGGPQTDYVREQASGWAANHALTSSAGEVCAPERHASK
jgi:hypothetical protein